MIEGSNTKIAHRENSAYLIVSQLKKKGPLIKRCLFCQTLENLMFLVVPCLQRITFYDFVWEPSVWNAASASIRRLGIEGLFVISELQGSYTNSSDTYVDILKRGQQLLVTQLLSRFVMVPAAVRADPAFDKQIYFISFRPALDTSIHRYSSMYSLLAQVLPHLRACASRSTSAHSIKHPASTSQHP